MTGEKEVLKTTCPRDCYDACGIVAIKRDGAITRVLGDPDHPVSRGALCGKCALAYNGVFRDPEVRLQMPLKRTGAKGEGRFEPVSWVEAMGDIAARFTRIAEGDGADRIVHAHLHRHLLADRQQLPNALPGPHGRPRGRARHGLQHGRSRRTRLRDRHVRDRLRPAHRQRLALHRSSGARTPLPPRRTSTSTG